MSERSDERERIQRWLTSDVPIIIMTEHWWSGAARVCSCGWTPDGRPFGEHVLEHLARALGDLA